MMHPTPSETDLLRVIALADDDSLEYVAAWREMRECGYSERGESVVIR